jgi:iron complex outermembrane receptor protein
MVFSLPLYLLAQGVLKGTVTAGGKPLENASVTASKGGGTITDKDGKYSLSLSAGSHAITFSEIGYAIQSVNVTITNGQETVQDIEMNESVQSLENVFVVGTRSIPRSAIGTPLPVDNLDESTLKSTGQPTFDKQLQYRVPSFNTVNTPVNDATTLLDPYEIRNLGPSRTLILVNGKRKNLSSLLYVQFSPGRGETGADISAIPVDAIKNVEILRDGASAQYGSDAIAGVMNIILKDRYQYTSLTLNGGGTSKGDGGTYGVSFNSGANIKDRGFLNYTVAVNQQDNAVRSGIVDLPTEIATFGDPSLPETDPVNQPIVDYLARFPTANNENGTGAITAAKFEYNLGVPIGEHGLFYSDAAYTFKKVNSNANYRTPYWEPDYGLLHQPGTEYLGYQPSFEGDLTDYNGTIGFRNEINGWKQDISLTVGGNQQLYSVNNTVNHSLKEKSPTAFKPGGYGFYNAIGNIDISKSITDNFAIGFGSEVRRETYKIIAGDTASYSGQGANSFPGIRQENSGVFSRYNLGGYVDASLNITNNWLVDGTARGEKYSDFGSAFVYKLSSRLKVAGDNFVLRGSVSTGFRAPTLHQIYDQSTQASFVGGTIQLSGLFNNLSKQAYLLGIPKLRPEKSTNYTFGFGVKPVKNMSITVDYYDITIRDRIVYSSSISTDDTSSVLYHLLQQSGVVQANFFINGIKTHTSGIDFVGNYHNIDLGRGKLAINLAANLTTVNEILGSPNDPKVISDAGSTILSAQIRSLLTESRPKYKTILGFDYSINKWNFNINNTLFGPTKFQDLDNGGAIMNNIKQVFKPAVVTDLTVGYNFSSKVSANITVSNLFNVLPKWDLELTGSSSDPNYADAVSTLNDPAAKSLLEGFLEFSGRYRILGYNGSQFSQLGTIFNGSITFRF